MGEVQWVKLYVEMFDKPKINKLRRLPAGNDILLFWIMLLATAGKCNSGGQIHITERVPFSKEDLADEFGFEISTIELALKAFVEFGMIDLYDDGFISVRNWEAYQNTDRLAELREYNRLAQQKSRAKKKLLQGVNDTSMTSQSCQGIEEEKEIDKEKEYHSFVHSAHEDDPWDSFDEESKLKYIHGTLGEGIVLMSNEQFSDLLSKLSLDELHKYFEVIKECEKNGKRYKKKTHYQAVLDMARKDRQVKKG